MHSLYDKITFVNDALFPDVYFVFFNNCGFIVSSVVILLGHNICVCHLLSNKEISQNAYSCATTWTSNRYTYCSPVPLLAAI